MILRSSRLTFRLRLSRILSLSFSWWGSSHKSRSWQWLNLLLQLFGSLADTPFHLFLKFIKIFSHIFLIFFDTLIKNIFFKCFQLSVDTITNLGNLLLFLLHTRSETCHTFINSYNNSTLQLLTNIIYYLLFNLYQPLSNILLEFFAIFFYWVYLICCTLVFTLLVCDEFRYCWEVVLDSVLY